MDRSISQAAVYEKNFSLASSNSDVNKKTFDSVRNREETCAVSTGNSQPELRASEGAGETLLLLKSANVKNETAVSNFTQPTMSSASHKSFDDGYEPDGVGMSQESYWEMAAHNWVVDSCKKDSAQKSAENNIQEDMHEETVEVSDEEWSRIVWMYGPSDLKAEMLEKEKKASEERFEDLQSAMRNSDFEGFLKKYPGTDPSIFVPV